MVNLVNIIRNDATGEPVLFNVHGLGEYDQPIGGDVSFHDASFGELVNGESTITFNVIGERKRHTITFTLELHDSDKGVAGATNYAELQKLVGHTAYSHGAPATGVPLWQKGLNALGLSIANIFGRLESVEKALALLMTLDKRIFVKWIVRGTEFQCEMPNVKDGLASFDLKDGFDGFSEDLNPDDPNDSRQMLYLKTREFGTFRIITARQELGRIRDAVNANSDVAVHSEPLPAEEETDDGTT